MVETIENKEVKEGGEKVIDWTKKSLSLLEKETWINFFKKASDWIKNLFWIDNNKESISTSTTYTAQSEGKPDPDDRPNDNSQQENKPEDNLNTWTNEHLSENVVKKARDYIANWWTFHSNSKWIVTRGRGKYKHVCSTWSFNVLRLLWLPKVSKSTECDLKWTVLPKMWFKYIWEVDPKDPGKNWYKPQDGDTAVWPRFQNGRKMTQHQATFIHWHWVSDTIQNKMSCYPSKNEPMAKVYRFNWKPS